MQGRHLFDISHKGRNISVVASSVGRRKRYLGSINGAMCAIGSSKGDVLRRLIEVAPHYPKADRPPSPGPRRKLVRTR